MSLSDTEARYSKTRCQQAAAAVVHFAREHGVSEVVLEDFTAPKDPDAYWLIKRWPWFQLNEACISACEAAGIRVSRKVVSINRKVCPSCANEHQVPPTSSHGVWECSACGLKRTIDQYDALWMLRVVGRMDAVERSEERRKKTVKMMRSTTYGKTPPPPGE